ncbi:hypothetical protein jhhlp_003854 [Lomentospora prolificans]|uniref:Uncharacterized protein n=1 Tax=Lomentospora prolificans TaxID=41688 RepID=A0A2N3N9Y0_9PEZI|nr:hypothetical protein jhhlp_003854 [Lomentospora prolificans]
MALLPISRRSTAVLAASTAAFFFAFRYQSSAPRRKELVQAAIRPNFHVTVDRSGGGI